MSRSYADFRVDSSLMSRIDLVSKNLLANVFAILAKKI